MGVKTLHLVVDFKTHLGISLDAKKHSARLSMALSSHCPCCHIVDVVT